MFELIAYEGEVCSGCEIHPSLADADYTFKDRECPVCADSARFARIRERDDEEALKRLGENPSPEATRPTDGRHTSLRFLTPTESAEMRRLSGS